MLTGGPVQADAVVARKAGRRERRVLVCMVVVFDSGLLAWIVAFD